MSDSLISEHILEKSIHIARLVFYMIGRWHYVTTCARFWFFWIFENTIWLNWNLSQFWWGRALIHTFVLRIQNLIMHYAYNPPGVPSHILSQKMRTILYGTYSLNLNKSATNAKKRIIYTTIRDKWPSPMIGHHMRSTYLENCSGFMLTFMPSGRFTKNTHFLH
jgi:hypothetical protein